MPNLYLATTPVHAERYQPGMTEILGRRIVNLGGQMMFAPFSIQCVLQAGDWVVEHGDRLINKSGEIRQEGTLVIVLADAQFRRRYRLLQLASEQAS